jgi:hypothetical protein
MTVRSGFALLSLLALGIIHLKLRELCSSSIQI